MIKALKIIGILIGLLIIVYVLLVLNMNNQLKPKHFPEEGVFEYSAHYIDPEISLLNEGFVVCDENFILQYYNPERATYSKGKNGLRKFILASFKNNNFTDSGYLNIRFIINCKGEAGRYLIHENDLDLKPKKFNPEIVEQLFKLTTQLKKWNPNFTHDEYRDSYMYISYRIENGEITEIIP